MTTATISATSPLKQKRRTKHGTAALCDAIIEVLAEGNPMTVRQVYYQLVAAQVIANNRGQYQAISNLLVGLRKSGAVPWGWVEDRLRQPRIVSMWDDLEDFVSRVSRAYRRDVWATQPTYVECWLEKDALSGIFEDLLRPYGVTLNVGRGFDGWDSIHNAAERYAEHEHTVVLYWGDFDPSGEDMVRSLIERLQFFDCEPSIIKCALTADDVRAHSLPTDFTKRTDTRRAAFVEKYGDVSVELDALPTPILRGRIVEEVERHMDTAALAHVRDLQAGETLRLRSALETL